MSESPEPHTDLPPEAVSVLADLLAGLDRLDPILALPAHPGAASPGIPLGRYVLRAQLGAGRFGVVLLADDTGLRRQVAVKVPQPEVLTNPELRDRFVREAQAAARLGHPGVVPVFEAGEVGRLPYLTAGYVPGPSLAGWLRDRPGAVPAAVAAGLVRRVAEAVHHAHEHGVIHCDMSPSNILLQPAAGASPSDLAGFTPVVTDFGLARLVEDDPALTRTFRVAGTRAYMSPEQARGERRGLTARSDVYSLGAVLFELLTGRPPIADGPPDDAPALSFPAVPPSPRRVNPAVQTDLAAVCIKCLERDSADRYPSAADLAADLGRFLDGLPVAARRIGVPTMLHRWVRRNPMRVAATAAFGGLLAATIGLLAERWTAGLRHAPGRRAEVTEERADVGGVAKVLGNDLGAGPAVVARTPRDGLGADLGAVAKALRNDLGADLGAVAKILRSDFGADLGAVAKILHNDLGADVGVVARILRNGLGADFGAVAKVLKTDLAADVSVVARILRNDLGADLPAVVRILGTDLGWPVLYVSAVLRTYLGQSVAQTADLLRPLINPTGAMWYALDAWNGPLGLPTSVEVDAPGVPGGRVGHFQGGDVYWSAGTGAHAVSGPIRAEYDRLGGPRVLGLPTSGQLPVADVSGGRVVHFQGGSIYWSPGAGAHVVRTDLGAVAKVFRNDLGADVLLLASLLSTDLGLYPYVVIAALAAATEMPTTSPAVPPAGEVVGSLGPPI